MVQLNMDSGESSETSLKINDDDDDEDTADDLDDGKDIMADYDRISLRRSWGSLDALAPPTTPEHRRYRFDL